MQIWLIRDGEKLGPYSDFDVRRDIEDGQYTADTPAWHEGLESWTTLGEMSVFRSEFQQLDQAQPAPPSPPPRPREPKPDTPPPLPDSPPSGITPATDETSNPHLLRRFWARWMDLQLYIAVWWLFLYFTNADIGALFRNPWFMLLQLLPWLFIEAALIRHHGTTPGKWLLGIHVRNDDGSALTGRQSGTRTLRVLVAGVGLGLEVVTLICQGLNYWITRRFGRAMWDRLGGHHVDFSPIHGNRYIAALGIIFISLYFQTAVLAPHTFPLLKEQFPTLQEYFENPPRHFPDRHQAPRR